MLQHCNIATFATFSFARNEMFDYEKMKIFEKSLQFICL